jgi:hypothetical protein
LQDELSALDYAQVGNPQQNVFSMTQENYDQIIYLPLNNQTTIVDRATMEKKLLKDEKPLFSEDDPDTTDGEEENVEEEFVKENKTFTGEPYRKHSRIFTRENPKSPHSTSQQAGARPDDNDRQLSNLLLQRARTYVPESPEEEIPGAVPDFGDHPAQSGSDSSSDSGIDKAEFNS